jgi:hypothetical protein
MTHPSKQAGRGDALSSLPLPTSAGKHTHTSRQLSCAIRSPRARHHLAQARPTYSETATLLPQPSPSVPVATARTSLSARGATTRAGSALGFPSSRRRRSPRTPGFSHLVVAGVLVRFPRGPGARFHAETAGEGHRKKEGPRGLASASTG